MPARVVENTSGAGFFFTGATHDFFASAD